MITAITVRRAVRIYSRNVVSDMSGNQQLLEIFDKEELENLPSEDKRDYYRGAILSLLRNHEEGVSTTTIRQYTGFSQNTVKNHLEYLVTTREAYKREYGGRNTIYFPNGTLCHADIVKKYVLAGKKYSFKFIINPMGEHLYIQEMERDLNGGERVEGGLVIDRKEIPRLIEILKGLYEETSHDGERIENTEATI